MDPCLVVSPHLDDAVLSAGQLLAGWPTSVVLTVCAGVPHGAPLTSYDRECRFRSSEDAVRMRRDEDHRATARVGATPEHLDHLDGQYGGPFDRDLAVAQVLEAARRHRCPAVFGPLGLVHPDHVRVRDAYMEAAVELASEGVATWLYEDLPSRVLYPESVGPALDAVRRGGAGASLLFAGTGPKDAKRAAVRCYRSQLWALDADTLYVPERFWRLAP